jgi:hypothetical protein
MEALSGGPLKASLHQLGPKPKPEMGLVPEEKIAPGKKGRKYEPRWDGRLLSSRISVLCAAKYPEP